MVDLTLACVSHLNVSHRIFSDVFVPRSVPVAPGTSDDDLPVENTILVGDVRVLFKYRFPHGTDCPLTRRSPFGSIVARLQTLRPATAVTAWYSQ